jgi:predicted nucleic acid-binding protein
MSAFVLIDAGPIIAYYSAKDKWHSRVKSFYETFTGQLVTTCPVVTEAMHLMRANYLVQNELLSHISRGLYTVVPLEPPDFARMAELNIKYAEIPCDFADLSLVVVSERLDIKDVASLDSDFDIYRRFRRGAINQVLWRSP